MSSQPPQSRAEKVRAHWDNRAALGETGGTQDRILKHLEMKAIQARVRDGMRVLDAGCGNGVTALDIAGNLDVDLVGFDFASQMVSAAQEATSQLDQEKRGRVQFCAGDVLSLPEDLGTFDLIYTERVLINLPDWASQRQAIESLLGLLREGGVYIMCENSQDGLDRLNVLRRDVGLHQIDPPWHNRYLKEQEVLEITSEALRLEEISHFTSTYYFLSRVVNAAVAARDGKEPQYDSSINQLALDLPSSGNYGQTMIWVWRMINNQSAQ